MWVVVGGGDPFPCVYGLLPLRFTVKLRYCEMLKLGEVVFPSPSQMHENACAFPESWAR